MKVSLTKDSATSIQRFLQKLMLPSERRSLEKENRHSYSFREF